MICPKCKKDFFKPTHDIYKHGKHSMLRNSCPHCNHIISDKKINSGQLNRVLHIVFLAPFIFIALILLTIVAGKTKTDINYTVLSSLSISAILLLLIISQIRSKIQPKVKSKIIEKDIS